MNTNKKKNSGTLIILFLLQLCAYVTLAQPPDKKFFTHADSLRGQYGPERDWWDVLKYDLHVKFNIEDSSISGYNILDIMVLKQGEKLQIDLQEPMIVDSIFLRNAYYRSKKNKKIKGYGVYKKITDYKKDGNAYFISNPNLQFFQLAIYYHGKPVVALRPPWDGGVIWKKDKSNSPWVSIACQGLGASVWYPCKDHQQDEPDEAELNVTCPDTLVCVGNGRFRNKKVNGDRTATYSWFVVSPINNYNIIPYIGKYVHFSETYKGKKGKLSMDYWVLDYNLEKAKKQFTDAARMMKAFEHWFGPYPFYKDGYKLVESPHLGMEHQSGIAYGNGYQNGFKGTDLSASGWGMKWDFIIVHESGHEWFANNITTKDLADMWVHEGFTNYSETLFTDYYYGREAGNAYVIGTRKNIDNDIPVIGKYGVNNQGSGDMYYKAGNMLHIIRQLINNDEKFRKILQGLNKTFYHQTVTTKQIEDYISNKSGLDLSKIFDQYLRTTQVPVLEYKIENKVVSYRWDSTVAHFDLPVKVSFQNTSPEQWLKPTPEWQTIQLPDWYDGNTFIVNENFYVKQKKVD